MIVGKANNDTECFDVSAGFVYGKGFHVVPYANGTFAFRLDCGDPKLEADFFRTNAKAERFALALDDNVVAIYHQSPSGDPTRSCGLFSAPSLPDALAMCEAVADSWGVPQGNCYELCAEGDKGSVCVENAPN